MELKVSLSSYIDEVQVPATCPSESHRLSLGLRLGTPALHSELREVTMRERLGRELAQPRAPRVASPIRFFSQGHHCVPDTKLGWWKQAQALGSWVVCQSRPHQVAGATLGLATLGLDYFCPVGNWLALRFLPLVGHYTVPAWRQQAGTSPSACSKRKQRVSWLQHCTVSTFCCFTTSCFFFLLLHVLLLCLRDSKTVVTV